MSIFISTEDREPENWTVLYKIGQMATLDSRHLGSVLGSERLSLWYWESPLRLAFSEMPVEINRSSKHDRSASLSIFLDCKIFTRQE